MAEAKPTPIIHLIGPAGGGKTTLCRMFLDAFADKSVLAVDASTDAYLTLSYGIESAITVADLARQMGTSPLTRESIDWALQDLPVAIPTESEAEILTWGQFPETLSDRHQDLLRYGLPRLLGTFDVVIWDGDIPEALFPASEILHLIVITPTDEPYCQQLDLKRALVLLSKAQSHDAPPPTAAERIHQGDWTFLGRLPPLSPPEKRIRELPHYFQECFHRLNLPFALRPHGDSDR